MRLDRVPCRERILRALARGPQSYTELRRGVPCAPTRALQQLVDSGLITKDDTDYILTDAGKAVVDRHKRASA